MPNQPLDPVAFAERVRQQRSVKKPTALSRPTHRLTVPKDTDPDDDALLESLPPGLVQLNEHPRRPNRSNGATTGTLDSILTSESGKGRVSKRLSSPQSTNPTPTEGGTEEAPTLPPTQMLIPTASSALASSSCNVDHDNDLIKRMLVGYMQRRKEDHLVSRLTSAPPSPDVFMRPVMAVSKLGGARLVSKVDLPPTKIPQRHWVVRETIYTKAGPSQRVTGAAFLDLKNHRRSVVFPSSEPNNRPEVYFLAQTLDLLLHEIGAEGGISGEEAAFRIVAERTAADDPQLEGSHPPPPKAPCTVFYDRGMQLWELVDAGLTEIARQVTPGCVERGVLLESLRSVATDLGTSALRVMQFCKEEACSQQAENAALEYELQVQADSLRQRDAEVARLQEIVSVQGEELEELRGIKERFQAMRSQIQLSAALLVRNDRLRPLLEAMEDADAERQRALNLALEADTRVGPDGESEASRERKRGITEHELKLRDLYEDCAVGNPQLALLASGVGGIDIAAVKQLVAELDSSEGRAKLAESASPTKGAEGSPEDGDGGGLGSPELYQEAVRYLLTLDEAVHAIDATCEPFYQKMMFREPALNTALAAGRWRTVAKAIGRHEMVLEQRERQWKAAMASATHSSPDSHTTGVVQRVLGSVGGSVLEADRLRHVTGTEAGHLRGSSHGDGVLEKQLALARIFRGAARNALLGVHATDVDEGVSNVDGLGGGGSTQQAVDPVVAESAAAQPEVQEFLHPTLLLPPSFAVGTAGVAKLFKETRTVLVEIVQRLCALALSAQFKDLISERVLKPPEEPSVPCDLCGRVDVADTISKHKNDAMVEFAAEAARLQRRLEDEIRDLEAEGADLRKRLGVALRHEKEYEQKVVALERDGSNLKRELQMMREMEGMRDDEQAAAQQRDAAAESHNATAFSPASHTSGDVIQRLMGRGDDETSSSPATPITQFQSGEVKSLPLVLEIVINCFCCKGGTLSPNDQLSVPKSGTTPKPQALPPPRAADLTSDINNILAAAVLGSPAMRCTPQMVPRPPPGPKDNGSRPTTPGGLEGTGVDGDAVVPQSIAELGLFSEDEERTKAHANARTKEQWAVFGAELISPHGGSALGLQYLPTGAAMGDAPLLERKREGQLFPRLTNDTAAMMTNHSDPRVEATLRVLQSNIDVADTHLSRPGLAAATQTRRNRQMQLFGLTPLSLTKSLSWLLRIIARFYHTKLTVDLTAIQERGPHTHLVSASEHLSNTLRNMFGTKGLIDAHAADIIRCCCQYFRVDPRVANFVKFLSETIHNTQLLFFFTRLSRAVDCCTVGLSYQRGTAAAFCCDEDQAALEKVSLERLRGVLKQTRLVRKPYAAALWDVLCDLSTTESISEFKGAQRRAGIVLVGTDQHPRDWSPDDVSRGRMTVPKSVFLSMTCHFEQALRDTEVTEEPVVDDERPPLPPPKSVIPAPDELLLSSVSQDALLQRLQMAIDSGRLPAPRSR